MRVWTGDSYANTKVAFAEGGRRILTSHDDGACTGEFRSSDVKDKMVNEEGQNGDHRRTQRQRLSTGKIHHNVAIPEQVAYQKIKNKKLQHEIELAIK